VATLACGRAGIVLAAVVIAFSKYGTALKQFMADSRVELRKIVWPNRQETGNDQLVVFVFLLVAGFSSGVSISRSPGHAGTDRTRG